MKRTSVTIGSRVRTWTGELATVMYRCKGATFYGVAVDGERTVTGKQRVDEWPAAALTAEGGAA